MSKFSEQQLRTLIRELYVSEQIQKIQIARKDFLDRHLPSVKSLIQWRNKHEHSTKLRSK